MFGAQHAVAGGHGGGIAGVARKAHFAAAGQAAPFPVAAAAASRAGGDHATGNGRLCGSAILPQRFQDRPDLRRRYADRTEPARRPGGRLRRRRPSHRRSGQQGGLRRGARGGRLLTDLHHHAHVQRRATKARRQQDIRRDDAGTGIGQVPLSGSFRPLNAAPAPDCLAARARAASPASGRDSRSRSA